jgi:hypothetical protein
MAFPGTFNINYYKGDTYEFKIYPKDANGGPFPLTGYDLSEGSTFTISTERGFDGFAESIEGFSRISPDRTHITCAITPDNGSRLSSGQNYVYDVEIKKAAVQNIDFYPTVLTLLTGTIVITDEVTIAPSETPSEES